MDILSPISHERSLFFHDLFSNYIQKYNISSELSTFRSGHNIDHVINNNFNILCPNVEYEFYKGLSTEQLHNWLSLYKSYGDSIVQSFYNRYNLELNRLTHIIHSHNTSSDFDMSICSQLPNDILTQIYSFLPIHCKAHVIFHSSWNSILHNFRNLKVTSLINIVYHIKINFSSILHHFGGTYHETSNIKYLLRTPVQRTKTDIIHFIQSLVSSLLNVKIRLKTHRLHIIHLGYKLMILCKILSDKHIRSRALLVESRKAIKKQKRQQRIRALKNS